MAQLSAEESRYFIERIKNARTSEDFKRIKEDLLKFDDGEEKQKVLSLYNSHKK